MMKREKWKIKNRAVEFFFLMRCFSFKRRKDWSNHVTVNQNKKKIQ